jgi:hypothetical protein
MVWISIWGVPAARWLVNIFRWDQLDYQSFTVYFLPIVHTSERGLCISWTRRLICIMLWRNFLASWHVQRTWKIEQDMWRPKCLTIRKIYIPHTASKSRNNFHSPFFDLFSFLLLVTLVSWQFSSLKLALTLNPTHFDSFIQRDKHFIAATSTEPPTL